MKVITCLGIILIPFFLFADFRPGAYRAGELTCGKKSEQIEFELIQLGDSCFLGNMRITYPYRERQSHMMVEYYGTYVGDELILNKFQSYKIQEESLKGNYYQPGRRSTASHRSPFAWQAIRIVKAGQDKIRFEQVKKRYTCKDPIFTYDGALSERYEKINELVKEWMSNSPIKLSDAKKRNRKIFTLHRWGQKLFIEHPEINPEAFGDMWQYRYIKEQKKISKLFTDEAFIPVFGKAFDRMTKEEKQALNQEIQAIARVDPRKRNLRSNSTESFLYLFHWQPGIFSRALQPCGRSYTELCAEKVDEFVRLHREHKKGYDKLLERLNYGEQFSISELQGYRDVLESKWVGLWPSEKQLARDKIITKERIAAQNELATTWEEVLGLSDDPDKLARLEKIEESPAFLRASDSLQAAQRTLIDKQILALVDRLMTDEREKLPQITPQSLVGAADLVSWFRKFEENYLPNYKGFEEVEATLDVYFERRVSLLLRVKDILSNEIRKTETEAELKQLGSKYLYPINTGNKLDYEFKKLMNAQLEFIFFQTKPVVGEFTGAEIEQLEKQNTTTGEPLEDQMKLALYKRVTGATENYKKIANSQPSSEDPIGHFMKWAAGYWKNVRVKINDFQKISCVPADNKPGFICDCSFDLKVKGTGLDPVYNLVGTSTVTHRFVYTVRYGWISMGEIVDE